MTVVAVIPARFASTRFPGKPLARQTGKFLIQHVFESAAECSRLDRVVVATDDERIAAAVNSFGGEAIMTASAHPTGTDRVVEAAEKLSLADHDIVINVQGDEPELHASSIDAVIETIQTEHDLCGIATLACPFADSGPKSGPGSPLDPNRVKVVLDDNGRALYFSRSPIPYLRATQGIVDRPSRFLLHLGVYAFRWSALRALTDPEKRGSSTLEDAESLEQLRWLQQGWPIAVALVQHASFGIDTPEDYEAFVARMRGRQASSV